MNLDWELLIRYAPELWTGLVTTLEIAGLGMAIALSLGAVVCAMRRARSPAFGPTTARSAAVAYITFFRITPEVILIFWAYSCMPMITGWRIGGFTAGTVTLGLIGAAYFAEIFRSGIEVVPRGQIEAARALGLKPYALWRCVVLPQALRFAIPSLVSYTTEFLKNTTLLAAIGVGDLALQAYVLGGKTFHYFEFLSAIGAIYFLMIFPLSLLSRRLELRGGRG